MHEHEERREGAVDRRDFLARGASTLALAAIPWQQAGAIAHAAERHAPVNDGMAADLDEKTIAELQAGMRSGAYTSRSLVQQYLDRIDAIDRRGPTLRAVIETNPDALSIADAMDAERRAGKMRGPLHGIPVLVKDNIDTADRMLTTAGSLALADTRPVKDAFIVQRLRAAGAVILGKTNLSEWANFRSTHSSSGWSGRGGQARNPYALDRTPSGSSSGSAIATAANCCTVAVGTETDGSVLSPSAACSLVGLKPTIGLVSRSGIIPIAHSQDTAGPMARTVMDAAILLGALAGADPEDSVTSDRGVSDYTKGLDTNGLRGARLGVLRGRFSGANRQTDALYDAALAVLKAQGAVLVDPVEIATLGKFDDAEFEVLLYEFKTDLEKYFRSRPAGSRVRTLQDLIAFDRAHAAEEMPFFGQEIVEMAAKKGPLTSAAYRKGRAKCIELSRTKGIDATMKKHRLDALVMPTQGPPALIDLVNGDPSSWSSTTPAAVAGYPSLTVPMGYADSLPVGLTITGPAWSEALLLRYGFAYEQASRLRKPPRFLASAELAHS